MRATWFVPVVLSVLALAGCSSGPPVAAPPVTVTVTVPPSSSPPPTTTTTTATSTTTAAPVKGKCTLTDVRPEVTAVTGAADQQHRTTVTWTNVTSSTCTMAGFGGVDLQGPANPMGPTFSLRRAEVTPSTVRLAPGEKAHSVITWLPGGNWAPTKLLITPPDETHSAVLDWPGGTVLRQDGATRPGTFLGPVQAGASA